MASKIINKIEQKLHDGKDKKPKVLIVLTSHNTIDGTDKPTGWYLPELAHPYDVFLNKVDMVFASPKGGEAPLDPASVEMFKEDESSKKFLENNKDVWENTEKLSKFVGRSSEFDALFYPGGHGPMYDLAYDQDSMALINEFVAANKPIAAVCHGPAVFANVKTPDGKYLIAGKEVAGFTNEEETQAGLAEAMPYLLEDKLKENGGVYKKADQPWAPFVLTVDDGKFITGQNPSSALGTAKAILKAIRQ